MAEPDDELLSALASFLERANEDADGTDEQSPQEASVTDGFMDKLARCEKLVNER